MASAVRRLQSNDRAAHSTAQVEASPAEDDSNPLALLEEMGMGSERPAPTPVASPARSVVAEPQVEVEPEAQELPQSVTSPHVVVVEDEVPSVLDGHDVDEEASTPATAPLETAAPRTELLDILASLAPIFRAAAVYPGPAGSPKQIEEAIRLLSQTSVALAERVGRETDDLEVDMRWRRSRASALAADLVTGHWLTAAIRQGGTAFDGESMQDVMPRLSAGVSTALRVVREYPTYTASGSSPVAALFAMAPLVIDLQHYADIVKSSLPDFEVDIDAAAAALGAVIGEEVQAGVVRLTPYTPAEMRIGLASELLAQVSQMAMSAWQVVRGDLFAALKNAVDTQEAMAVLGGKGMSGGVPISAIANRVRPMVRQVVGATEYAVRVMLPKVPS